MNWIHDSEIADIVNDWWLLDFSHNCFNIAMYGQDAKDALVECANELLCDTEAAFRVKDVRDAEDALEWLVG